MVEQNATDITNIINSVVNIDPYAKMPLRRVVAQCEEEMESDPDFKDFIEQLQVYTIKKDVDFIGLEEKLIKGNREEYYEEAEELKERFTKLLFKSQFSPSTQKAYAHILGSINSLFRQHIKPRIKAGEHKANIDSLVYDAIVNHIYAQIADLKINLNCDDITGMLYYLTGNCHIKWD